MQVLTVNFRLRGNDRGLTKDDVVSFLAMDKGGIIARGFFWLGPFFVKLHGFLGIFAWALGD